MKKLVSIIVPVFNVEKYLRQCLDSILGQTFNQFEVIIVNDGSTDNSGAICQEYEARDNRIVYLEKENEGVSEARNLGLDFATSEYIIWELYTSLHHQQHIVFMRISKKTISVLEVAFSILIVVPF